MNYQHQVRTIKRGAIKPSDQIEVTLNGRVIFTGLRHVWRFLAGSILKDEGGK